VNGRRAVVAAHGARSGHGQNRGQPQGLPARPLAGERHTCIGAIADMQQHALPDEPPYLSSR
jgi:hypothetical protein